MGVSLVGFVSTVYFARELGAGGLGVYFAFETVVTVLGVVARFGVDDALIKRLSAAEDPAWRRSIHSTAFASWLSRWWRSRRPSSCWATR